MEDKDLNTILVKVQLPSDYNIDGKFLLSVVESLNDRLIPVSEIQLNDTVVFDGKTGFHVNDIK